jgi:hypothetical protein
MWNYSIIKETARDQGKRIKELLALAPANDPFYTGRPSELEAAEWFAEQWRKFGYSDRVHLRRVHYQIVSQDPPVNLPNGKPYANTDKCWGYLVNASKWARYLDLVPADKFEDKRNQPPTINYHVPWDWPEFTIHQPWESLDLPSYSISGYHADQPFLVELWVEKTTMNDVLEPLCHKFDANLVTGAGELSITAVIEFLERVREANKPARILYISDFDPAGMGMPISIARKIEFYQRKYGFDDLDIKLQPIVLTEAQVRAYKLPRVPVKDSDRRKKSWIDAYGAGQTELDALEALYPGVLKRLVTEEIMKYYDLTLRNRVMDQRDALQNALNAQRAAVLARHQEEIDALRERIEALQNAILSELDETDISVNDYPLPEPKVAEDDEDTLYDSKRGYLQQLGYYKSQRNGGNGHA